MSKELSRGELPPKPKIKKIGNVTLIGIHHDMDITRIRGKLPMSYLNALVGTDHLLIENLRKGPDSLGKPIYDYTDHAYGFVKKFKREGSVHEIDGDHLGLLIQNGVGIEESVCYASFLTRVMEDVELEMSVPAIVDVVKQYPAFASFRRKEMRKIVTGFEHALNQLHNSEAELLAVGFASLVDYHASIIDYGIMSPTVSSLVHTLKGNKTVMVGENHIPALESVLKGEAIGVPLRWVEYVNSLDSQAQKGVELFNATVHNS